MELRTKCLVPHCRRTRPTHPLDTEWLCQKHWSILPKVRRQAYSAAKRKRKDVAVLNALWRSLSRQAVEQSFTDPFA